MLKIKSGPHSQIRAGRLSWVNCNNIKRDCSLSDAKIVTKRYQI